MKTIGSMLDRQKGFGPGFDFLRVALATGVVAWHTHYVLSGNLPGSVNADQTWLVWFPGYAILVMFFALSGFLIAASGLRLSLKNFLINRGMRIIPALAVEVVLSALILGPVFTTLPLSDYFASLHTYQYLTNIVGLINYFLPGVFVGNPAPEVNNSLWTVPFEYACYAVMAAFIVFGLLRKPALIMAGALLLVGVGLAMIVAGYAAPAQSIPTAGATQPLLTKLFGATLFLGRGSRLLVSFMLGIAIFLYRDKLPYDWRLFAACVVLCVVAAVLGPAPWMTQPLLNAVVCPALVYITAFLGVSKLPRLPLFSKGDYSYGIYLYGFPVQQAVKTLLPVADPFVQFAVAMVLITLFAAFSWHVIEKPILKLRRRFSFVARERLAPTDAGAAPREWKGPRLNTVQGKV
jgi:peptidoglycan/LPS O-acetylase OafA/YrhL